MKKILLLTQLLFSSIIYSQTSGNNLFNENTLHEIRFNLVDTLSFENSEEYQMVNISIDNNTLDSIGFKKKGNISSYSSPNKFGIKVKTNKYVSGKKYDGIKEFTLHMNFEDPSFIREKLTYDLCNEIGLNSLRTAFVKVYINDIYWGVYTLVEGKDEKYKNNYGSRDLDAIESLDFGDMCYISNDPNSYNFEQNGFNPTYILENGNASTAWPRFSKMIDKANNSNDINYLDTVSKYLNLEHFFKYQAINVYLLNSDSYIGFKGNQIYVFDTINQLWQILPWDFNASFGSWNTNTMEPSTYPIIPNSISNGCIAEKINTIQTLKNYYMDGMCDLFQILNDTSSYFEKIDFYKSQIQEAVYTDYRKHITNTEFDDAFEEGFQSIFNENKPNLKTFIKLRNTVIQNGLIDNGYNCNSINNILEMPDQEITIFPNPTNGFIKISHPLNFTINNIKVIDQIGKTVLISNSVNDKIDLSNIEKGLYFLYFELDGQIKKHSFIKF
ncbi:MAG: CotH kinase family protein [Fluviicola sp.]